MQDRRTTVLLKVELQDMSDERELDSVDDETAAKDLVAYAGDWLVDHTRKEFEEPWRVFSVKLYEPPMQKSQSTGLDLD